MPNVNELFSLKGRTAIVTGGGQGLGKSMAIGLAQAGADIVIAARRIETALATQKEIEALGVKCTVIKGDMRVEEDVIRMVNQVVEEYAKIDILFNNAGTFSASSPLQVPALLKRNTQRLISSSTMPEPGGVMMRRRLQLRTGKRLLMLISQVPSSYPVKLER